MAAHERLAWYAQHFEMVEVNSTFYSVPDARTVERWCATTPDNFTFDVKVHQLFSFHSTQRKLLPPELQRLAQTDQHHVLSAVLGFLDKSREDLLRHVLFGLLVRLARTHRTIQIALRRRFDDVLHRQRIQRRFALQVAP